MPRFSTTQFTRGNLRPQSKVWEVTAYDEWTAVPEVVAGDGTRGAYKYTIRANVPTYPALKETAQYYQRFGSSLTGKSGINPFTFVPPEVRTPFEQYTHGVVLQAKLELRVIPQGATVNDTGEGLYPPDSSPYLPSTDSYSSEISEFVYNPEAQVTLVLSEDASPLLEANPTTDSVVSASADGDFKRAFNTSVRNTTNALDRHLPANPE